MQILIFERKNFQPIIFHTHNMPTAFFSCIQSSIVFFCISKFSYIIIMIDEQLEIG